MAKRLVDVKLTAQLFSADTVAGKLRYDIDGVVQDLDVTELTMDFAPGKHTVSVTRLDAAGIALSVPATDTFEIAADVSIDVPVSVTITVAP